MQARHNRTGRTLPLPAASSSPDSSGRTGKPLPGQLVSRDRQVNAQRVVDLNRDDQNTMQMPADKYYGGKPKREPDRRRPRNPFLPERGGDYEQQDGMISIPPQARAAATPPPVASRSLLSLVEVPAEHWTDPLIQNARTTGRLLVRVLADQETAAQTLVDHLVAEGQIPDGVVQLVPVRLARPPQPAPVPAPAPAPQTDPGATEVAAVSATVEETPLPAAPEAPAEDEDDD